MRQLMIVLFLLNVSGFAVAGDIDKAKELYSEGRRLIDEAENSNDGGKRQEGIRKLEAAMDLLEGGSAAEQELLVSINNVRFWAMKMTKLNWGGGGGSTSTRSRPSRVKEADDPGEVNESATLDEAKAAYERAEKYLRLNPTDYLGSAAQFFAVGNQYRDQKDVAFKAISKAQELQAKGHKAKEGDQLKSRLDELPTWQRYLVEGETMLEEGQIDAAMKKFEAASRLEPRGEVYNKLGHAHFKKAQQQRDDYTEAYLEAYNAYQRASSAREKSKAARQARAARMIADKARKSYSTARQHFQAALRKNDNLDLDSEFHVGLCNWSQVRPLANSTKPNPMDIHYRNAQKVFGNIMLTYYDKLDSTVERTLYATAENYLSDTQLAAVERQIERRRAAAERMKDSSEAGKEEDGPSELADMSRKEIQSHIADVNNELAAAQEEMDQAQRLGRFDMELMRKINDLRRQIQQAEDELLRR